MHATFLAADVHDHSLPHHVAELIDVEFVVVRADMRHQWEQRWQVMHVMLAAANQMQVFQKAMNDLAHFRHRLLGRNCYQEFDALTQQDDLLEEQSVEQPDEQLLIRIVNGRHVHEDKLLVVYFAFVELWHESAGLSVMSDLEVVVGEKKVVDVNAGCFVHLVLAIPQPVALRYLSLGQGIRAVNQRHH